MEQNNNPVQSPTPINPQLPQKHLHPSIWVGVLIAVSLIVGYLVWANASKEWPFAGENRLKVSPKQDMQQVVQKKEVIKTKNISDQANLYSLEIPEDWKITRNQSTNLVNISFLVSESPDWKSTILSTTKEKELPCDNLHRESGAYLLVLVNGREEPAPAHTGQGNGPGNSATVTKSVTVGGATGTYHQFFEEPCSATEQTLDAHVNYKGYNYLFSLAYSPSKYPQGEEVFANILKSAKFLREGPLPKTGSVSISFSPTSTDIMKLWKDNAFQRSIIVYDTDETPVNQVIVESMIEPIIIDDMMPGDYRATVENLGPAGTNSVNFKITAGEVAKVTLDLHEYR